MNPEEVARLWRDAFGETQPGHDMAWQLRFHSLPHAKQYPDSPDEYAELLRRHNEVASAVLGEGGECLLLVGLWPPTDLAVEANRLPERADLEFVEVSGLPTSVDEENGTRFMAAAVRWCSGCFDDVIRDVADERLPVVVFANLARASAYKPYDGGGDVICASAEDLAELSQRFGAWLP